MRIRHLLVTVVAVLGVLAAGCSGESSSEPPAFPETARYMADMTSADGAPMAIGISVDGSSVAAYACNGTDDEAWFFGDQSDGAIKLTSRMRDTLTADYDGTDVNGTVTMNGGEYPFTAASVSGLAGMYTAESDGVRASWVVRPDGTATGVQFSGFSQGDRNFDPFNLDGLSDFDVRNDVRNKRKLGPAGPIEFPDGRPQASINGQPVSPILVTGTFRLR
ncbi:hypothetical protein CRI77_08815 [Mycolicibacterium duvalii]|uniref:hypothetical protein n=1 Tax=Mycolicibacterium duvalii TaxID=39688 RepID=UPI000BEF094D|nr:hypothetical protein [Mycolicibacterium duvalii]MCV7369505.1 hypothetical protein [Mycolicibacterium duvalii]PEG42143.1 hypothetical protein CRI77_08815 [Mycolicibacterium duvalii]